ncbi:MAG: GNAT family N-acetyltransferase [Clostridium sp.]|nr:GNAT family N-acetyltransferase [Clostridium sp.]
MVIREMTSKDIDSVLDMMRIFYNSPAVLHKASDDILKKDIEDCISDLPFIEGYIIEHNNEIAGYSMLAKSYSTEYAGICIWIEDLYIKPEYRSLGLGTQFFEFVNNKYDSSSSSAAVRFRLEVEPSNKQAIHVYKKCGYNELPYIEMTKEL